MAYPWSGLTDFFRAATQRHLDARTLYQNGRFMGAAYLKRYELECILKYELLLNLRMAELERGPLNAHCDPYGLTAGDLHDLAHLYNLLVTVGGIPLNPRLVSAIGIVHATITIHDRYYPDQMSSETSNDLFGAINYAIEHLCPIYWRNVAGLPTGGVP